MKFLYRLATLNELYNEGALLKPTVFREEKLYYKSYIELCDKTVFDSSYAQIGGKNEELSNYYKQTNVFLNGLNDDFLKMRENKEIENKDIILLLYNFNAHKTLLFEMIRSKKGEFTDEDVIMFIEKLGYSQSYINNIKLNLIHLGMHKDTGDKVKNLKT